MAKFLVGQLIFEHYLLDEMSRRPPANPYVPSSSNLWADIQEAEKDFNRSAARVLRDYCAYAAFRELRHSKVKCRGRKFRDFDGCYNVFDGTAFEVPYSLGSIVRVGSEIFYESKWTQGYGGPKWGLILDVVKMYPIMRAKVFVNHVINLAHNGGLMLDKPNPILYLKGDKNDLVSLMSLLTGGVLTRDCTTLESHNNNYKVSMGLKLLVGRCQSLWAPYKLPTGLFGYEMTSYADSIEDVKLIKWGLEEMPISGRRLSLAKRKELRYYDK